MKLCFDSFSLAAARRPILRDLTCEIRGPGVAAVLGPSGVGKSTILRATTRLLELDPRTSWHCEGDIRLDERSIFAPEVDPVFLRRRVGLISQAPAMFAGSVLDNLLLPLRKVRRLPRAEQGASVQHILGRVGLLRELPDLDLPAAALSGGQAQRLAIGRALATDPEALLLDEPTSALDPGGARTIADLLRTLGRDRLVVLVTHDLQLVRRCADHVLFLDRAPEGARLIEQGPVTCLDAPDSPALRNFVAVASA